MVDYAKKHKELEERIKKAQENLRETDQDNQLLPLVTVDSMGIHYSKEFGERYESMSVQEGLTKYAEELETVAIPK